MGRVMRRRLRVPLDTFLKYVDGLDRGTKNIKTFHIVSSIEHDVLIHTIRVEAYDS